MKNISSNNESRGFYLHLDNVLVWEITSDRSRSYRISLQGYDDKCLDRVMISDGVREATAIGQYERNGCRLSICSVACKMSTLEQNSYNTALDNGEYDTCILNLFALETYLNSAYGYSLDSKKLGKRKRR